MFVTKGGGGEDAWEQSREAVKGVLDEYDAEIDYLENWADQEFQREIDNERRGKYLLAYFRAQPSVVNDIRDSTQLEERILRLLILNRDREDTYRDMIQDRIEAKKEEEEEEEEEESEEEEDVEAADAEDESEATDVEEDSEETDEKDEDVPEDLPEAETSDVPEDVEGEDEPEESTETDDSPEEEEEPSTPPADEEEEEEEPEEIEEEVSAGEAEKS